MDLVIIDLVWSRTNYFTQSNITKIIIILLAFTVIITTVKQPQEIICWLASPLDTFARSSSMTSWIYKMSSDDDDDNNNYSDSGGYSDGDDDNNKW